MRTSPRRRRARPGLGGLATAVAAEHARRCELAELVPDHVFLHEDLEELVAVVHLERVPDELGDDRARAGPRAQRLLGAVLVQLGHATKEFLVDVRSFFGASAHSYVSR